MNHREKTRLARRMRTPRETRRFEVDENGQLTHEGIFTSAAWDARRNAISARIRKQQGAVHDRAVARREAAQGRPTIMTRMRRQLEAMRLRREESRRERNQKYQRKHAVV